MNARTSFAAGAHDRAHRRTIDANRASGLPFPVDSHSQSPGEAIARQLFFEKRQLAVPLQTSVRTLEEWLARGIVSARIRGGKCVFTIPDVYFELFATTGNDMYERFLRFNQNVDLMKKSILSRICG